MGKITLVGENPPQSVDGLREYTGNLAKDVIHQINGNITFQDNLRGSIIAVNFSDANTDKTIRHSLNRVPLGYLLIESDDQTTIYTGSIKKTTDTITLRSSAIAETTLFIF
jgi:hypothetical protein